MQLARAGSGPEAVTETSADAALAVPGRTGRQAARKGGPIGLRPSRIPWSAPVPVSPAADCPAPAPAGWPATLDARPGMPLPEQVRESARSRFGRSFDGVRVHADAEAARMAAAAHARAFTLGQHVVFGAEGFHPGTNAGAALMWHELTHVAAAGGRTTLLRAPLYRSTEDLIFNPPPKGTTEPQMRARLDAMTKKTPPDITGWHIKGAAPTSEAFIFLEAAVFEFGTRDQWNTVARLDMEIGWEKPLSAHSGIIPSGLVTITIDAAGVATAELMVPGSIAMSPTIPAADGIAKVRADFGASIVNGDRVWTATEIGDVVQALGLLKPGDRAALRGVQIVRVATLPHDRSGEFSGGGGVAMGATTAPTPATLKLADSAFPRHRFALGPAGSVPLPGSEQTILHEVGHAVEAALERAALEKTDTAVIRQNVAKRALDVAVSQARAASGTPGAQQAIDEYNRRRRAYEAAAAAATAARTAQATTVVGSAVLAPLEHDVNVKKGAFNGAHAVAVAAMRTASAGDAAASSAYQAAISALGTLITDYVTRAQPGTELDPLDEGLTAAKTARDKARADLAKLNPANPALAAFGPVDTAQDELADAARALGHTRGRTKRLQKFVDVVKAAGIVPGLTPYSHENWPNKPQEFYAETFSLWLTEPDFLKNNYPALFTFFESGDYAR